MILIENKYWLNDYDKSIGARMKNVEENLTEQVVVEESKEGIPTLKIKFKEKYQYLHSKYRPSQDASRLLDKYKEDGTSLVLFWGVGLGYHIDEYMTMFPNRKFLIYEPNEEVFYYYMKHSKLSANRKSDVMAIQIGMDNYQDKMIEIIKKSKGKLQIISLPLYEKEYSGPLVELKELLIASLKEKKQGIQVELGFQQRWTLNAVKNFPEVIQTPNILKELDLDIMDEEVAIIVAAGPSLNYEYENLRKILKEKLAYVFAAGSAINALIEEDIQPHAFVTYDPKEINRNVTRKIKDIGINNIPMIFGSTTGYETIEGYPGPMYHFHTNQDHISSYLIGEELPNVNDAPTIAVITLQLLLKMGFKKIVFVGQNLAFSGDYRHAKGIGYEGYKPKITEEEEEELMYVLDVDGNKVKTKEGFESMRQQLEMYIKLSMDYDDGLHFVNTTKGGALIENAEYKPLEQIINEGFFSKVNAGKIFKKENTYDLKAIHQNLRKLKYYESQIEKEVEASFEQLRSIKKAFDLKRVSQIDSLFGRYDRAFSKVEKNEYYATFIKSMLRIQFDYVVEQIDDIKYEKDILKKAEVIILTFNAYLNYILQAYQFIKEYFEKMLASSEEIIQQRLGEEA